MLVDLTLLTPSTTIMNKTKNIQAINSMWNSHYEGVDRVLKNRRVKFSDDEMKANAQCECICNTPSESLTCLLHDGSNAKNRLFYDLVVAYFSNYRTFSEKDVITQSKGDINNVVLYLEGAKDSLKRLEIRKQEIFESDLYDFYLKKTMQSVPRVALMDDYDPTWDSLHWNLAAQRKQSKLPKVSLIKGGAGGIDGSLEYHHIPFIKNLEKLLENAHESMFLEFIII